MTTLKRYIIFNCAAYYPSGGMEDAIAHSDDLSAAQQFCLLNTQTYESLSIFDKEDGLVYDLRTPENEPMRWDVSSIVDMHTYRTPYNVTGVELFGEKK